jgi:hypothetical protein
MGKKGDNPFRSGNTAAIDLDQIDKEGEEGWNPWNASQGKQKNPWASDGWSGGGGGGDEDDWGGFGGGGGGSGKGATAALDISEFDADAYAEKSKNKRRRRPDEGWGEEDEDDAPRGRKKDQGPAWGRDDDGWDGGGGGGGGWGGKGNTAAIDLEDAGLPSEDEDEKFSPARKRRAERTEDARDPHTHSNQRGGVEYIGGQSDPKSLEQGRASRSKGQNADPALRPKESNVKDLEGEELDDWKPGAGESTVAIGIQEIRRGKAPEVSAEKAPEPKMRPAPKVRGEDEDGLIKTAAIDISSLQRGGGSAKVEVAPDETTDFGVPEPAVARGGKGKADPKADLVKTAQIDPSEVDKLRSKEAASGAKLLIFVPGNPPINFDLRPGVTNIGRDKSNHLVLSDPACSRKHLHIKKTSEGFAMHDAGSDNGTLLNGVRAAGNADAPLQHGSEITVGGTVLRFILGHPRPEDFRPPRFPSTTSRQASVEMSYTDQVVMPEAGVKPAGKAGGVPMAAWAVVGVLVLGVVALGVIAVLYFVVLKR